MSPFRPKSKFEYYFSAIGESLYLIVFVAAALFLIGFAAYQLFIGNLIWFKQNPAIIFVIILFILIGVSILSSYKKDKNKTSK